MSNVIRVFVEKREGFDVEARHMLADLRDNLGLTKLTGLRLLVLCFLWLFGEPMLEKLDRIKVKYGLLA